MKAIELVVTILGTLVFSGWLTWQFNYHSLFAETVSKSRMDWINCFREEISTIIAALERNVDEDKKSSTVDYRYEGYKAKAKLRTRLNMDTEKSGNEYNEALDDILRSLWFDGTDKNNIEETKEMLIELTRDILEPEWQRVKKEAKGRQRK